MLNKKRGQITIFIIIGILLLLIVGGVYFFIISSQEDITKNAEDESQSLAQEFNPVLVYIENCITGTAKEALIKLGQQGGYIEPEKWSGLYFNYNKPTDSDGITFSKESNLNVPYWHYNKNENKDIALGFDSNMPTIEDMESDLARYINENLMACLGEFQVFEEQGITVEEDDKVYTEVTIAPQNIRVAVKHELNIKRGDLSEKLTSYYQEVGLDLHRLHTLASTITLTQQNNSFLEKATLNLMEVHSGIDQNKLPPMTDSSFEFAPAISWSVNDVEDKLKNILSTSTSYVRYHGSNNFFNYQFPAGSDFRPTKQRTYNNLIIPMSGAEGVDVRFDYIPWWDIYLLTNADGDTIIPESLSVSLAFFRMGVQRYRTVYDISYPVFTSLKLPRGLDGQDYFFNFALESNIRDNRPANELEIKITSPITYGDATQFCQQRHRNAGPITVIVEDAYTKERIQDVAISYRAFEDTCTLGKTDENGILNTSFPVAFGGEVLAIHNDYMLSLTQYDAEFEKPDVLVVKIWKYKELAAKISKKKVAKCDDNNCYISFDDLANERARSPLHQKFFNSNNQKGWQLIDMPFSVSEDEEYVVVLERILQDGDSEEVIAGFEISEDVPVDEVRLVPGYYKVNIFSILNDKVTIPTENREIGGQNIEIPEVDFEPYNAGGIIWQNKTEYLYLSPSKLYSADEIEFYSLYFALPEVPESARKVEDVEVITDLEAYSIKYRRELEPHLR